MVLSYWLGIDALFYWLNRKAKRILTFHSVLPDGIYEDNVANGVSCSESNFRMTIRELKKKFRFSTDVFDADTLTITFDDGYLSEYEVAGRILKEEGDIPAIVFPAGEVMDGKVLLVDKLLHWAVGIPKTLLKEMGFETSLQLWVKRIWPEFVADVDRRGEGLYERLDALYPFEKILAGLSPEYRRLRLGGIPREQLAELRSRGWLVGWHTKSHYPLAGLSDEAQREELTSPAEMRTVPLSFPYGDVNSVDERARRTAKELGFPCALSDTIEPPAPLGRFFMPRYAFTPGKYMLHFELSGVKHFLKYRKLLPKVESSGKIMV